MKKIILFGILVFNVTFVHAQAISGTAEYTVKESSEGIEALNDPDLDPAMRKFIEEKLSDKLISYYTLTFSGTRSRFSEQGKAGLNNEETDLSWSPYGIDIAFYKDLVSKEQIIEKDLMGKTFYVKDSVPELKWQLLNETKTIGRFSCKKAIAVIPVSEEERLAFEEEKAAYEQMPSQFFPLEEPEPVTLIAWFSTDIPVMHGPFEYGGLPGLILELNDGSLTILCSKVSISQKKADLIKFPEKKKVISTKEFERIAEEKLKELENQRKTTP